MNASTFLLFCVLLPGCLTANTPQSPDILYFQGKKMNLNTGWGHPSPLETYFRQNTMSSPFQMISTANYRGYIATWEIKGGKLYLRKLMVPKYTKKGERKEKTYHPSAFEIFSTSDTTNKEHPVLADWFSGVIHANAFLKGENSRWSYGNSFYFHVRKGKIVAFQEVSDQDRERLEEATSPNVLNQALLAKLEMIRLNHDYIAYYYRLGENDTITFGKKGGYFERKSVLGPLYEKYDDDHLLWPYNWENREKNGAPVCTWIIEDSTIYLTDLKLHTGLGFYEIEVHSLEFQELFGDQVEDNRVKATWLTGVYIIRQGQRTQKYSALKVKELTFVKVQQGRVVEMHSIPGGTDFNAKDLPKGIKKMLEEY